jgi:putative FmdB family regulatory protein
MPTYEYHCKECGYTFDVRATVAEKERGLAASCEKCGSGELEQVFGGFSLITNRSVKGRSADSAAGGCCGGKSDCCS